MRLLLALAACLLLSACGSSSTAPPSPPNPVPPAESQPLGPSRRGLWFGYFGSDDAQVDETDDHTNMLFAAFGTNEQLAARIAKAAMPTILDVSDCLFDTAMPRKFRGEVEATKAVRARLDAIRDAGSLNLICALYVIDEPERESNVSIEDIRAACEFARRYSGFYHIEPALHICYGDGNDYRGAEFIDWIGIDAYGEGSRVLRRYEELSLHAHQKLVLYPGGANPYRNDPRPFYAYAQQTPEVIGICAFIWLAEHQGIKVNGMADAYREVGKAIIGGNA